jgi:hypothetical protein
MQKCFNENVKRTNNTHRRVENAKHQYKNANTQMTDLQNVYENLSSNPIYTTHMRMHTLKVLNVRKFENLFENLKVLTSSSRKFV